MQPMVPAQHGYRHTGRARFFPACSAKAGQPERPFAWALAARAQVYDTTIDAATDATRGARNV
jgi:hypothetical protein